MHRRLLICFIIDPDLIPVQQSDPKHWEAVRASRELIGSLVPTLDWGSHCIGINGPLITSHRRMQNVDFPKCFLFAKDRKGKLLRAQ